MIREPHHVLRDAPVATTWWWEATAQRIEDARPDELEEIAREMLPFAWGAIRKIRGGATAKRSWLRWALSLQRSIACRATDADFTSSPPYGIEDAEPLAVYGPLISKAQEQAADATPSAVAELLAREVGGEEWREIERGAAVVEAWQQQRR